MMAPWYEDPLYLDEDPEWYDVWIKWHEENKVKPEGSV